MKGKDIREKFLQFFAERGHSVIKSSPLVPQNDPTLLFTNAGMVQFKRVFMGEDKRPYTRAATSQCCVRAGGKHNDLENVGYTARHHTFFEMLGNFSFGDYFKKEAIAYAWEFLTKVVGLPPERLWVSVFRDDDEAYALWEAIPELPKGRIIRLGEKDNFWAMGDTGPCGPCSEILIDQGPEVGCGRPDCKVGCDCDRYLELWNLVFMQFYRDESGTLHPLPKPSIDTGMGLERVTAVVQGVHSNYESDIFLPIINRIAEVSGKRYGADHRHDTAMRVIADHSRATAFLVADGVLPSNEGRGYVLRRIMRRAIRYGRLLGLNRPFLTRITAEVTNRMLGAYPHLASVSFLLEKVVLHEEERFLETIESGLGMLTGELARMKGAEEKTIEGAFIFKLYDTYGFPVDIVKDVAHEEGFLVDEAGFATAMEVQKEQSRKSWKASSLEALGEGLRTLAGRGEKSRFVGYYLRRAKGVVKGLLDEEGNLRDKAVAGDKVIIVCPETPFYPESGGQAGDQGEIAGPGGVARVENTANAGDGFILHRAEVVSGVIALGDTVAMNVNEGRRQKIACNHTATHLLHAALRRHLGDHVKQAGSLVEPERLRFDFTHFSPIKEQEILDIERWVNAEIRANHRMSIDLMTLEEARRTGAMALFGEKYGETVRVISMGNVSRELCGGTHVAATGEIGLFKIVGETGIAAGVRRIEAVTGTEAFAVFQELDMTILTLGSLLKGQTTELPGRVEKLLSRQKDLEKEVGRLTAKLSGNGLEDLVSNAREVEGVRVLSAKFALDSAKTLRELGDRARDLLGSGIAVLGGEVDGKAALIALVSKDLTDRIQAGAIIKEVAALVGGTGGGRPDMAQAGGPRVEDLATALDAVYGIVASILKR